MKHLIFPLLILMLAAANIQTAKAQEGELHVVFTPLAILDIATPSIQFGAEYRPLDWLGLQLEPTIPLGTNIPGHETDRYSYWKIKGEARIYVSEEYDGYYYLGPEFGFITKSMDLTNGTFRNSQEIDFSYSYANIRQNITIAALKFGRTYDLWRFRFDGYTGVGIRIHNTNYSNILNPQESGGIDESELWVNSFRYQGKKIFPHVSMGVKIGFGIIKPDA